MLYYLKTLIIIELQHKFVNSANRMYNRLVVPLNRYNNFAGLLHSLDVFLGKEGATRLPSRDLHRLTPFVEAGAESLPIRKSNRFRRNSCFGIRSRSSNPLLARKKRRGTEKAKLNRRRRASPVKIGETDRRRDLDSIKMQVFIFAFV